MSTSKDDALVKQLLALLRGGQAHVPFQEAVAGFPEHLRGQRPDHLPYSAWQLVEHVRLTQRDILDFSNNHKSGYKSMKWPEDYWPSDPAPIAGEWDNTLRAIEDDREAFEKLLTANDATLDQPFAWGDGQTLLRQALLLADHTSYHTGEIILLRRLLGCWK